MSQAVVQLAYILATVLFIFALHWMNTPATARNGVYAGVAGMVVAIAVTWAQPEVVNHAWIIFRSSRDSRSGFRWPGFP